MIPARRPMMAEPNGLTKSQPAVIATKPAKIPFNVNENDGLPYLIQDVNIVPKPPQTAASGGQEYVADSNTVNLTRSSELRTRLNPNHPNQRMNTPRAAAIRL